MKLPGWRQPKEQDRAEAKKLLAEAGIPAWDALAAKRGVDVAQAQDLVTKGQVRQATDVTEVTFRPCSDEFLRAYIATGEPMDKAGAYGIQGYGAALVDRIDGDFFGVMGLPVRLVLRLMEEAGVGYRFGK